MVLVSREHGNLIPVPNLTTLPTLELQSNYITIIPGKSTTGINMTHIVKIGNSQGIRIPKPLIEQADLEGKELKLQLVRNGLLITPERKARDDWEEIIEQSIAANGIEPPDEEWLDFPIASDDELEW